jgi:hypothetical protein
MQTFDVSANILNDRLTFSTARGKLKPSYPSARDAALPAATSAQGVDCEPQHESAPVVRGFGAQLPCARTTFHKSLALGLLQLVAGVLLFIMHAQRFSTRFVCGAGLLLTPLCAQHLSNAAPSLALLLLLFVHDTLVVLALAA